MSDTLITCRKCGVEYRVPEPEPNPELKTLFEHSNKRWGLDGEDGVTIYIKKLLCPVCHDPDLINDDILTRYVLRLIKASVRASDE